MSSRPLKAAFFMPALAEELVCSPHRLPVENVRMQNVWLALAVWIGSALAASIISIRVAVSVALIEIIVGAIANNLGPSIGIGVVSFLAPYLGVLLYARFVIGWPWPEAQIAGISMSTTSVAVVYAVMVETGFNKTELGKIILAACFITDLGTVLAFGISVCARRRLACPIGAATAIVLWLLSKFAPWFFEQSRASRQRA